MTQGFATTPFGRRRMTLGLIATQAHVREIAPDQTVHKWRVFEALTKVRDRLGLPDRSMAVLQALLSFHQATTMSAGEPLVVFPSNVKLAQRAHGVAPATLRRHLAHLVAAGIVIRRDSPNGKRYARRGEGGAVTDAFGFDLSPLIARAAEFDALAAEVEAERRTLRLARERVTLARRDITKLISLGLEEGIPGDWAGLHAAYLALVSRLKRSGTARDYTLLADEMTALAGEISKHLELFAKSSKITGNESHFEHHIQIQNTDLPESEPAFNKSEGENVVLQAKQTELAIRTGDCDDLDARRCSASADDLAKPRTVPLAMVLQACPDIEEYAVSGPGEKSGIASWTVFLKTAGLVRSMLGISPDAWRDAVETMGLVDASILIAAILQKGDEIRFPGGYLRALTEKKRANEFSTMPILMALINTKKKSKP